MSKTFTCALCERVYENTRSEEEARAELKREFGDIEPEDCAVVCDDCWEKVRPRNNREIFNAWKGNSSGDGG